MSLPRDAAQGVFWSAIGSWGYQLFALIIFAILARLLSVESFGLVALAAVFVAFIKVVAEQGMADAIVQRAELDKEHLDTAFWASVALGGLASGIIAAGSAGIAAVMDERAIGPVLAWLSVGLLISSLGSVPKAILNRRLAFSSLTLRSLLSIGVGGAAGIAAAFVGLEVWSLVVQNLVTELTAVASLWTVTSWRPRFRFSWEHFKELTAFGANVVGFRVLLFLKRRSDSLLVGSFLGVVALGFYTVAQRLLQVLITSTTSIVGTVAFPVFSRIQEDIGRVQNGYYKAIRHTSLIAFPAFLGLIVIAPEATELVFGEKWDRSIPVMRVLALSGLLESVTLINGTVMKALGKPSWRLRIVAIEAVTSIVAFIVAVRWGIVAVATALVIANYATAPIYFTATSRLIHLEAKRFINSLLAPGAATLIMMLALALLKTATIGLGLTVEVIVLISTGIMIYVVVLWFFARPVALEAIDLARLALPSRGSSRMAPEGDV